MNDTGISLATAVVVTGLSRRTWWRRIAAGSVVRLADDSRGRATVDLINVLPLLCIRLDVDDINYLLRADAGDSEAQNDIGQLFSNAGKPKIAAYWLGEAARRGNADAMQWLGRCHIAGEGVAADANIGLMWIAKAASNNHLIAKAQIGDALGFSA